MLAVINHAGAESFRIAIGTIPLLILALVLVNILRDAGLVSALETLLTPVFSGANISSVAVLPIVTKYIAGGTAMLGVVVELMSVGQFSAVDLNRLAGFTIHPFDVAGVAILISSGPRVAAVLKPAVLGAVVAILLRSLFHLLVL